MREWRLKECQKNGDHQQNLTRNPIEKEKAVSFKKQPYNVGGRRGIRTPGTLTGTTV